MRAALKQAKQVYGMVAIELVRFYAWPKSFTMLMDIFDKYDNNIHGDCVIEFGIYEMELGDIPGHNIIVWEVRNY